MTYRQFLFLQSVLASLLSVGCAWWSGLAFGHGATSAAVTWMVPAVFSAALALVRMRQIGYDHLLHEMRQRNQEDGQGG